MFEADNFRANATADKVALTVRQVHAMSMLRQHRDSFSRTSVNKNRLAL